MKRWMKDRRADLRTLRIIWHITLRVWGEVGRAILKHGAHNTPLNPAMPGPDKLVILMEEIGEVARAMTYDEGDMANLRAELAQVSAVSNMWQWSLEVGA